MHSLDTANQPRNGGVLDELRVELFRSHSPSEYGVLPGSEQIIGHAKGISYDFQMPGLHAWTFTVLHSRDRLFTAFISDNSRGRTVWVEEVDFEALGSRLFEAVQAFVWADDTCLRRVLAVQANS